MSLKSRIEFEKAKSKSILNDLISTITYKSNYLLSFDEVKYLTGGNTFVYRGIQSIPLDNIKGSEGRYRDFDSYFFPKHEGIREKWENISDFMDSSENIPPISVYKIGDYYIVRDGNHRVSVARERGMKYIDAEVVEMITKFPIKELTEKELLLADGYNFFISETHFDKVFPNIHIRLTNPWGYIVLVDHINTYKYYKNQTLKKELCMEEVVKDWYQNLFLPVTKAIQKSKLIKFFPNRTIGDLYIWIMDHWHYLKENTKNPLITIEKAIEDFEKMVREEIISRKVKFFISLLLFPLKIIYKILRLIFR